MRMGPLACLFSLEAAFLFAENGDSPGTPRPRTCSLGNFQRGRRGVLKEANKSGFLSPWGKLWAMIRSYCICSLAQETSKPPLAKAISSPKVSLRKSGWGLLSVGVGGEWGLGSLSFPPRDLRPLPAYSCPGVQAELARVETMERWVVWGEAGREATTVR